jgi:hypothetical protein
MTTEYWRTAHWLSLGGAVSISHIGNFYKAASEKHKELEMTTKIADKAIIVEVALHPSDFTKLVERHLDDIQGTKELEQEASQLSANGFAEKQLASFIWDVCRWGGYPGIAGRVLKQNALPEIRSRFINAVKALDSDNPDILGALNEINQIQQLGQLSFASKHLRFLRPEVCPVLDDRIISKKLGYTLDAQGYKQFSDECLRIAEALQQYRVSNPIGREGGKWFAADVEMALFAYLRER